MKRLVIYDFDGTLIDSPEPDPGKQIWKEKTGEEYPHKGWWGRKESLNTDVFDIKPFPTILSKLKNDMLDSDTYTIILTSRMEKLRPQLENILQLNGITVDQLITKRGNEDKGDVIMKFIQQNPELREIVAYDDFAGGMENKIAEYTKIKDLIPDGIIYDIYYVENGKTRLMESTNLLLNMILEEIRKFKS
jgi:hypothetical protein